MPKRFVSVGVCIVDIVGTTIESIPEDQGTELIQKIHMCPAGTAAATAAQVAAGVGSNAGVIDFATTENIMRAGSLSVLEEDA